MEAENKLRDGLHKDLVQEACHKNFFKTGNSNGVLQLHNPIYIRFKDEVLYLVAIDCDMGYLIGETYIGTFKQVRYNILTKEELITVHRDVVENKLYSFASSKKLV
jgi:hypothetical protein